MTTVTDALEAALVRGSDVVFVGVAPAAVAMEVSRRGSSVKGRLAVFVGDPTDAVVMAAAEEMALELFSRPVAVT